MVTPLLKFATTARIEIVVAELLRNQRALLRITLIIFAHQFNLLAIDTAGGIELVNRQLHPVLPGIAEECLRVGQGAGSTNPHLGIGWMRSDQRPACKYR